jgi:hypothetical protein
MKISAITDNFHAGLQMMFLGTLVKVTSEQAKEGSPFPI